MGAEIPDTSVKSADAIGSLAKLTDAALSYLRAQLRERSPRQVLFEATFDERPLEGEGLTAIFSFDLEPPAALRADPAAKRAEPPAADEMGPESERSAQRESGDPAAGSGAAACAAAWEPKHYVAVGQTEPNYFPAYGLDADGAYGVHVGSRFMLEMGVARIDAALVPPSARPALREVVAGLPSDQGIRSMELAALFACADQKFAVYRLKIDDEDVYALGADCPPGFYRMTRYPPQAALRLHLGQLLREEARRERAEAARGSRRDR